MRRRVRNKRSKKRKIWIAAAIAAAIAWGAVSIKTEQAVAPIAKRQAEYYSKLTANEIISEAVSEYIKENQYTYGDFAAVLYDENGRAVSIEMLTFNVNKVQAELTQMINKRLAKSRDNSASIPVGSLTESYLLAGRGPDIRLRICPASEAKVELRDSFEGAGMNQTCHKISALITVEIESSLPLYSFSTEVSFEFLLRKILLWERFPKFRQEFQQIFLKAMEKVIKMWYNKK